MKTDPLNCGSCGTKCAVNQLCVEGVCRPYAPSPCATCGPECCTGVVASASATCCPGVGSRALRPVCIGGDACP
jgi:hypothetical protein